MLVDIGVKRDPEVGIMAIMGSIAVKMIFCMAFVLIYSIKAKGIGLVFLLNFFLYIYCLRPLKFTVCYVTCATKI